MAIPDGLPDPEGTAANRSLTGEMHLARNASDGGYGIVDLHVQVDGELSDFHTKRPPDFFTEMIASACVMAQLHLLKHSAPGAPQAVSRREGVIGLMPGNCPAAASEGEGPGPGSRLAGAGAAGLDEVAQLVAARGCAAQLCVIRAGQVVADWAWGCAADSLFWLFSASKPLVALAVHQLAERGQLSLDDTVAPTGRVSLSAGSSPSRSGRCCSSGPGCR